MRTVALCLNMTKTNSKEVRKKMADAGIVPEHLQLKWLVLNINDVNDDPRWTTSAQQSYHGYYQYMIVEPDQFIDVFSLLFLNPSLHTFQYLETIKLTKKQVYALYKNQSWKTWCVANYPEYFN